MPLQPPKASQDAAERAFENAVAHHQAARLAEAEKAYNEVLKIDWGNGDALRLLGGLYIQLNQPEKAITTLKQAAAALPKNAEILNNLGIALRNQSKISEAIDQFEAAIKLKPDYAEAYNNLGHAHLGQSHFSTAAAVFEKALVLKPDYPRAAGNLAAALRELGRFDDAATHLERVLKTHSKDADILHDYALTLQKQGKLDAAVHAYRRALDVRPQFFAALNNYGSTLRELGKTEEALEQYERAVELAPKRVEVYINLAAVFWDVNRLPQAIDCYERALAIEPNAVEALVNYGAVLWAQGKPDEAKEKLEAALRLKPDHASAYANLGSLRHAVGDLDGALAMYDKALRIDSSHPHARFAKGLALLAYGQYNEGWMFYEAGLDHRHMRGLSRFPMKSWNGMVRKTVRLVIWSEQGFGDALQFIRYAPLCKERVAKVIVLCPKALHRLFKAIPGIDEVRENVETKEFDEHVAMLSLPYVFGTTLETVPNKVPYLYVDDSVRNKWAPRFKDVEGLKVGLVWAGNARENMANANLLDKRRSIHLEMLKPLFNVPGVSFVSLQMGPATAQIDEAGLRGKVLDIMSDVGDFADTAAIVQTLDLVITVDTSVAHLVGGLGKPVWILSRYDACWRWLRNREDSPWYPTARIFGQPSFGVWDPVIGKIHDALTATVAERGESIA